jgi:hypothetical protein
MLQLAPVFIPLLFVCILVPDGHLEFTVLLNVHAVFSTCLKSQLVTLYGDMKFDLMLVNHVTFSIDEGTDILPHTTVHYIATMPCVLVHYRTGNSTKVYIVCKNTNKCSMK